jgi:RNA polymerase sigma-70 factor (sigma-E family)
MSTGQRVPPTVRRDAAAERARVATPGRRDRDAEFTAFVAESGPALVRMAWLLCGDRTRGEDLAQQALLRTYVAWSRVNDPLAYARRVVATARIDTWRQRRREVLSAPDELPAVAAASAADDHAERDRLIRALRSLPPKQRRIVVLRYLLDLPEAEVAADLGVSLGTVKSTASRGLDRLRVMLDGGTTDIALPGPGAAPTTLPDATAATLPDGSRTRRGGDHD